MSQHIEWFTAAECDVALLHEGDKVNGDTTIVAPFAIAIGDVESCAIVQGTHEGLRSFLTGLLAAVIKDDARRLSVVPFCQLCEQSGHLATEHDAVLPIHKAAPWGRTNRCRHCHAPIKRVIGGGGWTYVHTESGTVSASGPPRWRCTTCETDGHASSEHMIGK